MASIMPLTADDIDAICEIDDGEMPAPLAALMAKPAFAGLGLSLGLQQKRNWRGLFTAGFLMAKVKLFKSPSQKKTVAKAMAGRY